MGHIRSFTIHSQDWYLHDAGQIDTSPATSITGSGIKTAGELPSEKRRMAFPKLWGGIKSHFQVGTYKDLSPVQYDAALSYIDSYEWEVLDKEETVSAFSIAPVVYTKPDGYEESRWVDRGAPRNDKT